MCRAMRLLLPRQRACLPKAHGLERASVTARVVLRTGRVRVYHAALFIRGLPTTPRPRS
jgi:hypothetical protein